MWFTASTRGLLCGFKAYTTTETPLLRKYPIYNGAKPENPCSVFLGAFSGLLRENVDLPYAALRPTSIRLSRDAKTATPGAGAEKIGVEPLRPPCFPDNDAIFVRGREVAKWQMQRRADASSQLCPRDRDRATLRQSPRNALASG